MLAAFHAGQRHRGVHEIGHGNRDRVDVPAFFVEHHAVIFVLRRLLVLLLGRGGAIFVHVANRDDVFGMRGGGHIGGSLRTAPDYRDVQFFTEWFVA